MPTYTSTIWPAMIYPGAVSTIGNGGTAAQPTIKPAVLASATAQSVNFTAVPLAPVQTTYISPITTQQGINTTFKIIDENLTFGAPSRANLP